MKLFVTMPFADEFTSVYEAVREVSRDLGMKPIRVGELCEPGPIIEQIVTEIWQL